MNSTITTSEFKKNWLQKFGPIWLGQAFSLLGSGLVQFALIWHLTVQTGSTAVLATATLVAMLPGVILGPFAGALVDRWDRRRVMIFADTVIALVTLGLVALFYFNVIQIWHIYAAMFLRGLGGAFHWPAMQASTSLMVPEEHLSRLAGANQALRGLINIAAPPLGALLLELVPLYNVLAIDIVTAAVAVAPLIIIAIPRPVRTDAETAVTPASVLRDVRMGLKYVAGWPGMLTLLVMASMINFLLNPAFSFLPLLVTRHFEGGAIQLGWLESVFGVGVIIGGVILTVWGGFQRRIITSMLGLIGMGVGVLAIGIAPGTGYSIALAGMGLTGLMNPLCNGPLFALLQSKVEPAMQGRIFTLVESMAGAMSPLGLLVASPVAEWLGIQAWYVVGGVVCALMGAAGLTIRIVASLDDQMPGGVIIQSSQMQPAAAASD